jgi:hypothetical protein
MTTSYSGEAALAKVIVASTYAAFTTIFYLASTSTSSVALLDGPDGSLSG